MSDFREGGANALSLQKRVCILFYSSYDAGINKNLIKFEILKP